MRNNKHEFELVGDVVRIFQRGRKWYANFQLDGKQHRHSLGTTSKKEARRQAIQLEAQILDGRFRPPVPYAPLESAIDDYMKSLETENRAAKTLSKYGKVFARFRDLAGRHHILTIDKVSRKLIDAYRNERVAAGVSPKTLYTETVILRQLINFALSREVITVDPLRGMKLKKPKPTPQPCWTPAEVEQILTTSREAERSKFLVLADTGMRVGELQWLTWDDVDFERNCLHVRPKEGWKPKTGDQRATPMTPRVRELLASWPRRWRWVFTAAPSPKYPKGDRQFSERRLLVSLKRVLKRLGLKGHVHTFRHAFISRALTMGTAEAIVREWVGHVDEEVLKLYTHIADPSSQAAMQRLAGGNEKPLQPGGSTDGKRECGVESAQNQHNERRRSHVRGTNQ